MTQSDCFVELSVRSNIVDTILERAKNTEKDWNKLLEQSILNLHISDFQDDTEIYSAIKDLGAEKRLSVFRFNPNVCYNWHIDKIRHVSINMLLDGFDSFCAFGDLSLQNKFINLHRLVHKPDIYYLMNVKKMHCVFNFSQQMRYILSIGIPDIKYEDVVLYFKNKNLLA